MSIIEKWVICIWVILCSVGIVCLLTENDRLGNEVIALQQSPDICLRCGGTME